MKMIFYAAFLAIGLLVMNVFDVHLVVQAAIAGSFLIFMFLNHLGTKRRPMPGCDLPVGTYAERRTGTSPSRRTGSRWKDDGRRNRDSSSTVIKGNNAGTDGLLYLHTAGAADDDRTSHDTGGDSGCSASSCGGGGCGGGGCGGS